MGIIYGDDLRYNYSVFDDSVLKGKSDFEEVQDQHQQLYEDLAELAEEK